MTNLKEAFRSVRNGIASAQTKTDVITALGQFLDSDAAQKIRNEGQINQIMDALETKMAEFQAPDEYEKALRAIARKGLNIEWQTATDNKLEQLRFAGEQALVLGRNAQVLENIPRQ